MVCPCDEGFVFYTTPDVLNGIKSCINIQDFLILPAEDPVFVIGKIVVEVIPVFVKCLEVFRVVYSVLINILVSCLPVSSAILSG